MEEPEDAPAPDDQGGMHPIAKAGRVNLIILLIYAGLVLVLSFVYAPGEEVGMWLFWVGLIMLGHGLVNLVLGIIFLIAKKMGLGKAGLLIGLLLLIIGFSTCVGAFTQLSFH